MKKIRIVTTSSPAHGPSYVRYAVEVNGEPVIHTEGPVEDQALVRRVFLEAVMRSVLSGDDRLPRGWLSNDAAPDASGALKVRAAGLREEIDNIEYALGLPARAWNPGDDPEVCDIDLTDAERESLKDDVGGRVLKAHDQDTAALIQARDEYEKAAALRAPARITDRAQLLQEPTDDNDRCDGFTFDDVAKDCRGDGHYLCLECKRLTGLARRQLIGRPDTDDTDDDAQE